MRVTGYKHSEDLERIMEINNSCYSGIYCPPRNTMVDNMLVSDVFVARVTPADDKTTPVDTIIGFAIVRNAVQPYVWNIAVDPAYQSRGVGGNLLREIIKRYTLEKCKEITLHVNVNNPAQKLYFDYGFRVVAVETDYFQPDDGLVMKRDL
jgi:ribosomal protein S18 acetylase RimI-like enzyme